MRFIFHGLGSRTTDRCLGAGLLNPSDPGARLMQAMEDIDRPFVCGCGGELASEGAAIDGDDKGERFAIVWVTAQGLRELNDVCGSEVEVCAGDRRFWRNGERGLRRASAPCCAPRRK